MYKHNLNPFLPNDIPERSTIQKLSELILLLLRLPLFLGLIIEIIIFNDLIFRKFQNLNLNPNKHKVIRAIILLHNFFLGRLLLLVIGYFKMQSSFDKNIQDFKYKNLQSYCFFCSRISPIDIFAQITYFSPSFTHITIREKIIKYKLISYFQAIIDSFNIKKCSFKQFYDGNDISQLMEEIDKKRLGPLIVFWEGGVSNGRHLLRIDDLMINEACKVNQYAKQDQFKIKYNYTNPSGIMCILVKDRLNLIGKSWIKMVLDLLSNWNFDLKIYFWKLPHCKINQQIVRDSNKQFVKILLKRKISKKCWLDFQQKYVSFAN